MNLCLEIFHFDKFYSYVEKYSLNKMEDIEETKESLKRFCNEIKKYQINKIENFGIKCFVCEIGRKATGFIFYPRMLMQNTSSSKEKNSFDE